MTQADRTLAALMRAAQWRLDEAAFELGAGRYDNDQCATLAHALTRLAEALRQHRTTRPQGTTKPDTTVDT